MFKNCFLGSAVVSLNWLKIFYLLCLVCLCLRAWLCFRRRGVVLVLNMFVGCVAWWSFCFCWFLFGVAALFLSFR